MVGKRRLRRRHCDAVGLGETCVLGVVFLGSGCCFKVWVLLGGGPELVGSMISVSGLVSWVKWSLELNGLKRLMVSGAFGRWCFWSLV